MYTSRARHLFSATLIALVLVAVLIGLSGAGPGPTRAGPAPRRTSRGS